MGTKKNKYIKRVNKRKQKNISKKKKSLKHKNIFLELQKVKKVYQKIAYNMILQEEIIAQLEIVVTKIENYRDKPKLSEQEQNALDTLLIEQKTLDIKLETFIKQKKYLEQSLNDYSLKYRNKFNLKEIVDKVRNTLNPSKEPHFNVDIKDNK